MVPQLSHLFEELVEFEKGEYSDPEKFIHVIGLPKNKTFAEYESSVDGEVNQYGFNLFSEDPDEVWDKGQADQYIMDAKVFKRKVL